MVIEGNLIPQVVHSHLHSPNCSQSSTTLNWFTAIYPPNWFIVIPPSDGSQPPTLRNRIMVIYPPQLVHSRLPSTTGSQISTLPKWFTVIYHPQLVHSHLPSATESWSSILPKWFTDIYHPQLVHSHLSSTGGSQLPTIQS